jgi:hypothetical protein
MGIWICRAPTQTTLADGLYRVETATVCAGFMVRDQTVIACAPILRKAIRYWLPRAVRSGP